MEDLILQTRQDILDLTEVLLHTKKELDGIAYFTRKKIYKHLESKLGMDLDGLSAVLLEIRSLLANIEEKVQQKRYDDLDRKLLTLKYQYLDRMGVLIRLSAFYQDLCPPLERYWTKREILEENKITYTKRQYMAEKVYRKIHAIYEEMSVDEV